MRPLVPIHLITCAAIASVHLAAGCGGPQSRSGELLTDVRGYAGGIRWQKYPQAAVRVPPPERSAFLSERAELEDDLRIADFEIAEVGYLGRGQDRARVVVKWTWHLDSRGIVNKTTTEQAWRRHGKRWLLVEERHLRGEPMPGVAEPADEPDPDDAAPGERDPNAPAASKRSS